MRSSKEIKDRISLMEEHEDLMDFCSPPHAAEITLAESLLGLGLPESYRTFLENLGCGAFGATEIFGIIPDNVPGGSAPCAVWFTLNERQT